MKSLTRDSENSLRSWEEVVEEYNRRHPDKPISMSVAVQTGVVAMRKLRREFGYMGIHTAKDAE